MSTRIGLAAAAASLLFVPAANAQPSAPARAAALAPQHYGAWGFDLAGMDRAVRPGDDFYEYADGTAVKAIQIPPDQVRWGGFSILAQLSRERVRLILEEEARTAPVQPADVGGKIGAAYKAFMDEARVKQLGAAPLKPDLDAIRAASTKSDLIALMGRANDGFFASIFDVGIQPDEKDPNRYSVHLGQSGLGLPDRDYYLKPSFAEKKAKYQAYVAEMLAMGGWPDAVARAAEIVALETKIAEASWPRADERDPDKTYNRTTVAALATAAPGFDWALFMQKADLGDVEDVVVQENTAFPKIAALFQATPLDVLKAWLAFHVIDNAAPFLSSKFVDAEFAFHGTALEGQPQIEPRWRRAVNTVDANLGEAVGQIYVARYFPPSSKAKMEALVGDLKAAFRARIEKLDWMSAATKAEALKKLAAFTVRIGYPDKWRDYSALTIRSDDLYGDMERGTAFEWAREVNRLHKPVDKGEWEMTPQTVNAYNEPVFNEVVFPAAILQPPFFDPDADPAVNFGGIGGVIGHEMTHGFDDQGRKFDAEGRLRDWWTPEDARNFEARAAKLGAQYSTYQPVPGAHVNGQLTMGENIADQGGLTLALDAYHASLNGRPAPMIGGLTGDQRVFLGWAQVWRSKTREDTLRQRVVVDPHSPDMFRVNGVVRNIDGWYAAFDVKPGEKLYLAPKDRAHIW